MTNKIEEDTKDTAEFTKGFHSGYQDRDKEVKKVIDELHHEFTHSGKIDWEIIEKKLKSKLGLK